MSAMLVLLSAVSLAGWSSPGCCSVLSARVSAPPAPGVPSETHAPPAPQFLPAPTSLVTAPGDHVTLECRVLHLQDKLVSWVRSGDLQILAAGGAVFTGDARVAATYDAAEVTTGDATGHATGDAVRHTLSITGVRATDAGRYECQVNTEPKMSQFYNLIVLDSRAAARARDRARAVRVHIAGERTRRVAAGGSLRLQCTARYLDPPDLKAPPGDGDGAGGDIQDVEGEPPPLEPRWYKDDEPIDLQNPWGHDGGVSLESRQWAAGARSSLLLARMSPGSGGSAGGAGSAGSAGRYSCRAGVAADTVQILVVDDDPQMDAMQRDQSLTARPSGGGGATSSLRHAASHRAPLAIFSLLAMLYIM